MKIRALISSSTRCQLVATGLLLVSCSLFGAVSGDEHWDVQFGAPGVTNNIFAVAVNNGLVYAAGAVPTGAHTNTPLNVWDGKQWTVAAVFTGPSINGPSQMQVNDLAFVGNTLYAAGSFTNVNGVTANGLARWDGTSWSGVGFSGLAYALAVDGNNLYVGGIYTNAGGVTTTNIGYWDGSLWHALGDGLGLAGTFSPAVRAIVVKNGAVYAGGGFINSGSQSITNLAVWNGSAWSSVGGGVNGGVLTLAFNGSDLYVGGSFSQAGTVPGTNIAKWDGAAWSALGNGLRGSAVESIAVLNGSVCAAGIFTNSGSLGMTNFAVWNGSSWSAAGNLNSAGVRAVSTGANLYVGGSFSVAGGVWVNQIASWDGTRWSAFGTPGRLNGILVGTSILSFITALANDGTNLYAAGNFNYAGTTNANFIARFDGQNWQPVGAGLNNQVIALAVSNNNVYAGGYFTGTADGQTALSYIGWWDGTNWNSLGNAGGVVYALAISSNWLYAAGTGYNGASSYGEPYFNRWDGTNWQNAIHFIPAGNTFFDLPTNDHDSTGYCAIAIQSTNVYLGGNIRGFYQFDPVLGPGFSPITNCLNIMRFDGNDYGWILGTGLNNFPVALAAVGTSLFAAGTFTSANGVAANQIAKWDGNNWSSLGGSVVGSGTVLSLTTMGNNLYAGGTFTNIGGVSANRIAKWDGTNWSAFGSGVSSSVYGLTVIGPDLYAAGYMRRAGDKFSFDVAHWNGQVNFNVPQLVGPAWLTNQQFHVRLMGVGGLTNIIQATTNFAAWTPILTNTAGIYDFIDPDSAANPRRFYRALLGP